MYCSIYVPDVDTIICNWNCFSANGGHHWIISLYVRLWCYLYIMCIDRLLADAKNTWQITRWNNETVDWYLINDKFLWKQIFFHFKEIDSVHFKAFDSVLFKAFESTVKPVQFVTQFFCCVQLILICKLITLQWRFVQNCILHIRFISAHAMS